MAFAIGSPIQRQGGFEGPSMGAGGPRLAVGTPELRAGSFESFKLGCKVKKTGLVKAEKGERVLTKKQQHERSEKKMSKR
jgi:hypothetical protein